MGIASLQPQAAGRNDPKLRRNVEQRRRARRLLLHGRAEPVADVGFHQQVLQVRRVILDLHADLTDEGVQVIRSAAPQIILASNEQQIRSLVTVPYGADANFAWLLRLRYRCSGLLPGTTTRPLPFFHVIKMHSLYFPHISIDRLHLACRGERTEQA